MFGSLWNVVAHEHQRQDGSRRLGRMVKCWTATDKWVWKPWEMLSLLYRWCCWYGRHFLLRITAFSIWCDIGSFSKHWKGKSQLICVGYRCYFLWLFLVIIEHTAVRPQRLTDMMPGHWLSLWCGKTNNFICFSWFYVLTDKTQGTIVLELSNVYSWFSLALEESFAVVFVWFGHVLLWRTFTCWIWVSETLRTASYGSG